MTAATPPMTAATPPMGWCTWNAFRTRIDEELIIEAADILVASGMRDRGYRYLVIDDGWQAPRRIHGRLAPDPRRFPSGIPALVREVRERGLSLGIYACPGRQTCAMIYDDYTAEGIGSYGYERADLQQFAEWGISYLKYDWCEANRCGTGLSYRAAFTRMRQAIDDIGWDGLFSISEYGRSNPWEWAPGIAHMWRVTPDIEPRWESVHGIATHAHLIAAHAGPGRWNDLDMLQVGNPGLSAAENRSHLALWAMLAAPLMAGNDLSAMDPAVRELLTCEGVIAIDQDPLGRAGRRIVREDRYEVWARPLSGDRTAIAVTATGDTPVGVHWDGGELRITDPHETVFPLPVPDLTDVWTGAAADSTEVSPHDTFLVTATTTGFTLE